MMFFLDLILFLIDPIWIYSKMVQSFSIRLKDTEHSRICQMVELLANMFLKIARVLTWEERGVFEGAKTCTSSIYKTKVIVILYS